MKIFTCKDKDFQDSFNSAHFLQFKVEQIFQIVSLKYKELGSVEIFKLSFIVPEICHIYIFNIAGDNSVMTYAEMFRFSNLEKL